MQKIDSKNEIKESRQGSMTILQLMAVLAILGILATWILHAIIHA